MKNNYSIQETKFFQRNSKFTKLSFNFKKWRLQKKRPFHLTSKPI